MATSARVQEPTRTANNFTIPITSMDVENNDGNPLLEPPSQQQTIEDKFSACEDTIASLLNITTHETQTFTNLCGLSTTIVRSDNGCTPYGSSTSLENSATCLFNDKNCVRYIENGLCAVHAKFRLATPIVEYDRNELHIIHAPDCDISNRQVVRIFPLLSFHKNLTTEDLRILNHNTPCVLADATNYLVGITKPLSNDENMNENKTEYIKKIIQFRDSHQPHFLKLTQTINKTNVYLYFTTSYQPQNRKVQKWFNESTFKNNVRVTRVRLSEIANMVDIYNILLYMPAKKICEDGTETGYIPDVIILDGYICYGAGYGQSKLIFPKDANVMPGSYIIKHSSYWEEAKKTQTLRIAPLTIDAESAHGRNTLVVLDLRRQQTLTTKPSILAANPQYTVPAIEGVSCT